MVVMAIQPPFPVPPSWQLVMIEIRPILVVAGYHNPRSIYHSIPRSIESQQWKFTEFTRKCWNQGLLGEIVDWLVVGPPLWRIWKSIGMIIPNIWENKKCSKPPTRWEFGPSWPFLALLPPAPRARFSEEPSAGSAYRAATDRGPVDFSCGWPIRLPLGPTCGIGKLSP